MKVARGPAGAGILMASAVFVTGARGADCVLPSWDPGPPLDVAVTEPAVTSCGGLAYAASGGLFRGYSPVTGTWRALPPTPIPVSHATLACDAAGGRLFLFGGIDISAAVVSLVQAYTVATNTWSVSAVTLPSPRMAMVSGTIGGSIYLVAGFDGALVPQTQNWRFNLTTSTFTRRASLPAPRGRPAAGVSGGRLYVMGGQKDLSGAAAESNYEYDPATNTWATKQSLPMAVNNAGGTALSTLSPQCAGDIIVVGGGIPMPQPTAVTQIYSVATDSWSPGPPLPTARFGLRAAQAGDALIAVGGFDGTSTVATVDLIQGPPLLEELQETGVD